MKRAKSYSKHIACLESFWNYDVVNRLSVAPILELLSKTNGTSSVYLTCNTMEEFKFNLEIYKRAKGFDILHLGFHGYPGGIYLPDLKIDIETLATLMGRKFRNRIIFFDSCSTLKVEKERIFDFISETEVMMVMGYKKSLNWIDGAATDLLVLEWLQYYKDMRRFWKRFGRAYRDLVRITGMVVYHK